MVCACSQTPMIGSLSSLYRRTFVTCRLFLAICRTPIKFCVILPKRGQPRLPILGTLTRGRHCATRTAGSVSQSVSVSILSSLHWSSRRVSSIQPDCQNFINGSVNHLKPRLPLSAHSRSTHRKQLRPVLRQISQEVAGSYICKHTLLYQSSSDLAIPSLRSVQEICKTYRNPDRDRIRNKGSGPEADALPMRSPSTENAAGRRVAHPLNAILRNLTISQPSLGFPRLAQNQFCNIFHGGARAIQYSNRSEGAQKVS